MENIQPWPLSSNEIKHNAFIDELFSKQRERWASGPDVETVELTFEEQVVIDYCFKHHLDPSKWTYGEVLYIYGVITFEELKNRLNGKH